MLLVKLVSSGVKKASAPAEIDPVLSPGYYSLHNTRTNSDTNLSLTAVSAETDGEGYLELREATSFDNNRHCIFDRLNDSAPAVARYWETQAARLVGPGLAEPEFLSHHFPWSWILQRHDKIHSSSLAEQQH